MNVPKKSKITKRSAQIIDPELNHEFISHQFIGYEQN